MTGRVVVFTDLKGQGWPRWPQAGQCQRHCNSGHIKHVIRNDAGIFYDYLWDSENRSISIKRDENNYPIVRFSLFNKKIAPLSLAQASSFIKSRISTFSFNNFDALIILLG